MIEWKQRYQDAHRKYQEKQYPSATKDHGHINTPFPDVTKSNGLTRYILNFLHWSGHRSTRINNQGRLIITPQKQASGIFLETRKYMHSTTRNGTADISATVFGRAVMAEIKCGYDKPSAAQLDEQARERAAGGVYEFFHNPDEFLQWYDNFLSSLGQQTTLL